MLKNYLPFYNYENIGNYEEFEISINKQELINNKKNTSSNNGQNSDTMTLKPLKHQELISNLMRGITPINSLLIVHDLGTGKTCTAVYSIEKNFQESLFGMDRAIILNRGKAVANNFINELVNRCTNKYRANNVRSQNALWSKKYTFDTFEIFSKKIKQMTDLQIKTQFNNSFIVIDEVHNLLNEEALTYTEISRFINLLPNKKVLLLSGTPVRDTPDDIVPILNLILPEKIDQKTFRDKYYDKSGNLTTEFKNKILLGRVSYLASPVPEIPIKEIGTKIFNLSKFNVVSHIMSKFQTTVYAKAFELDKTSGGVYNNSRQAIRMVYPDGSYGTKGYSTYIIDKKYTMKQQLKTDLVKYGSDTESILKRISELSIKYYYIIKNVLEADSRGEKTLIYDDLVKGSGLIILYNLLTFIGFKKARLLTAETNTVTEISNIQKMFNEDTNGSKISVLLGSRVIAEGFTFLDVIHEHIVPHWNNTETLQVLARGIRLGSHQKTLLLKPKASVNIYRHVVLPGKFKTDPPILQTESIDYIMVKSSEDKDIEINKVISAIKEASITCNQFNIRNGGKCIMPKTNINSLIDDNVNYGYQIYSDDNTVNINRVLDYFKTRYYEHINILSNNLKIRIPLLLNCLENIISKKISFLNSVGVICYLNRNRNIYFCVTEISNEDDVNCGYYSTKLKPFSTISKQEIFNQSVDMFVEDPSNDRNIQRTIEILVSLELTGTEIKNNEYKDYILNTYRDNYFIDKINNSAMVWTSESFNTGIYRCLNQPKTNRPWEEWINCEDTDGKLLELENAKKGKVVNFEKQMIERGMASYGLFNPSNKEFCIKHIISSEEQKTLKDKRNIASGKRCVNWSKPQLVEIAKNNNFPVKNYDEWMSQKRQLMCRDLYNWFEEFNMIIEDKSCGVQQKRK
ncbi:DEAD-like helicase [Dasineura jujubifolia toursvirus 2a]|nr:DEAD-like helicase [Dasineura jujubifolia toursvirus 2a]